MLIPTLRSSCVPIAQVAVTESFASGLLVSASIGMVTVGVMIGNAIAPFLRKSAHEERILIGALGLTAVSGIAAAVFGGVASGVLGPGDELPSIRGAADRFGSEP